MLQTTCLSALGMLKHSARIVGKTASLSAGIAMLVMMFPVQTHAANVDLADIPLYLGGQTKPNIMYILDDSGSMRFELMPNEIDYYGNTRYMFDRITGLYGSGNYGFTVPTTTNSSAYNAMTRSSDFNTLYYNPNVLYEPWTKADGSKYPNADPDAAYHNPENTAAGTRDLNSNNTITTNWVDCTSSTSCTANNNSTQTFYPATYFVYNGGDEWTRSNYTRVTIQGGSTYDRSGSDLDGDGNPDRTDCADPAACTYAEEMQNFANWYTYYRSRTFTARAGTGSAFAKLAEPTDSSVATRVGFALINQGNSSIDGINTSSIVRGVRPFTGTDRQNFYSDLYTSGVPAAGTPLRAALDDVGQYYSRTDSLGPWSETPGTSGGDNISCRQSYSILMTDGYWSTGNSSYEADTSGARENNDGEDGTTITGPGSKSYQYIAGSPFEDGYDNTLADVAMYYWKRDLTAMKNDVPTNPADPAFWQHMVTYGVSLGVNGTISDPQSAFDAIGDSSITYSWPDPFASEPAKVDDLLHAAVNGRGLFISAQNPTEFSVAMQKTLDNLTGRISSAASIATNSTRLDANTFIYQAKYDSTDWSGRLLAYKINTDGSVGATQWDAATLIPTTHTNRDIYTYNDATGAGVEFLWGNLSTAQQTALGSQNILNYIRGDASNEIRNGGTYRNRNLLLGDIVNSDPWFVGRANYGYGLLPGLEGDAYAAFIGSSSYINRTKALYVGSNDGMLHAVNAVTGAELFTYIPNSVYANLATLADKNYNHKYFVDGSPRAGAAYIDVGTGKEWRTVLLGSTGAGGRSIFALDVTDPSTFDESDILWEFTDTELGYTLGQPNVVRLASDVDNDGYGDWGAVFSNGYNSDNQSARIFIVNIEDGSLIWEFDSGVGDSNDPNGMATPIVSDTDRNGIADTIHAGDLHGNLWSIDISGTNTNSWGSNYKLGNSPAPLFTAVSATGTRQPITAKPHVGNDPNGGLLVYFGTGKYIEAGDNAVPADPDVQSIYVIQDNNSTVTRAELLQQSITYENDNETITNPDTGETFIFGARKLSTNAKTDEPGCYVDLTSAPPNSYGKQGERVVSTPLIWDDRVIFTTLIPNEDACGWGGDSWLMEFDRETCGALSYAVFDPDNTDKFTGTPYAGLKSEEGILDTPGVVCADKTCYKYGSGSSGNVDVIKNKGTLTSGRQTWMQLQ